MKGNAAEFDTQRDDVFGRIASRYDMLCDRLVLASIAFGNEELRK